jgi:hypothetical protein
MGNPVLKNVKDYRRTMTLGCVSVCREELVENFEDDLFRLI